MGEEGEPGRVGVVPGHYKNNPTHPDQNTVGIDPSRFLIRIHTFPFGQFYCLVGFLGHIVL